MDIISNTIGRNLLYEDYYVTSRLWITGTQEMMITLLNKNQKSDYIIL